MIATSGFLTGLECTKFVFGWALPRTPQGQLTVLPDRLALLLRKGGKEKERGRGGQEEEKGGKSEGRVGMDRKHKHPSINCCLRLRVSPNSHNRDLHLYVINLSPMISHFNNSHFLSFRLPDYYFHFPYSAVFVLIYSFH